MPSVAGSLLKWSHDGTTVFEDVSDRLNHVFTCGLLILLAIVISFRQTLYSPISCWFPREYKEGNRQYVNDVCWNSHVIIFPQDYYANSATSYPVLRPTSFGVNDTTGATLTLYQWVPLLLMFQALLFKFPHLFLYIFHGYSGLNFDKLVALTRGYERLNIAERRVLGNQIGRYLYNWSDNFGHCIPWRFLSLVYIVTKFLYTINIIVQICLLDTFLRTPETPQNNFTSFSDLIIHNIFKPEVAEWKSTPAFPRQVSCEYESIASDTGFSKVQCFLSVNAYNEMAYVIIWIWFLFMSTVTCTSLVSCLVKFSIAFFRKRYIMKALNLAENKEDSLIEDKDFAKFTDWVGEDGIMALKLIGSNSSEVLVSDVVCSMWKKRKRHKASNKAGYIDMTSGSHSSPPRIKIHPVVTEMED